MLIHLQTSDVVAVSNPDADACSWQANLVFRYKEFGSFCQIWQIWIVILWSCVDVKGNDKNQ